MNFVHISLLAGAALASLPVLMHLLSRRQPKKLDFPALRFVRRTAVTAQRGWRIKQWLLLLLRMFLILLAASMFAAPHVHSNMLATYVSIGLVGCLALFACLVAIVAFATRRPLAVMLTTGIIAGLLVLGTGGWVVLAATTGVAAPTQNATGPIATAIILDTSPTMDYQFENETRLEAAREKCDWLIERLPVGSQVAIVGGRGGARLSQDIAAAQRQIERVEISGASTPLPQRIDTAIDLVRSSDLERKEIYVLTNMTTPSWRDSDSFRLQQKLDVSESGEPPVLLQIIDVGIDQTLDWSISNLQLSQQSVFPGGSVRIEADVSATASAPRDQLTVELLMEERDLSLPVQKNGQTIIPNATVIDRRVVEVPAAGTARVRFQVRDLQQGTHQARLQIKRPDPLESNNHLDMTLVAREQGRVLVVSKDKDLGTILRLMIAPEEFETETASQRTQLADYFRLDTYNFSEFSSVVLLDPPGLNTQVVERLDGYVRDGGGLFTILGAAIDNADAFSAAPISKLLPGSVVRISRRSLTDRAMTLSASRSTHPVFDLFGQAINDVPWNRYAVFRHWDLEDLQATASTIMSYTIDGKPALIEESRGAGKILTLTTPIPEPARPEQRRPWNDLFSGSDTPWESFALVSGVSRYISGWGKTQLNYTVGQPVELANDSDLYPEQYDMFTPKNEVLRIRDANGTLVYPYAGDPGVYRLRGLKDESPVVRGFSVNLSATDSQLDRISPEQLDLIFGVDNYSITQTLDELNSSIGTARFGRSLYPFLLTLLLIIWLAEQAMSSRFYSIRLTPKPTPT
jgi:hypothetical protein